MTVALVFLYLIIGAFVVVVFDLDTMENRYKPVWKVMLKILIWPTIFLKGKEGKNDKED